MGLKMKLTGVEEAWRQVERAHAASRKVQTRVVVEGMTNALRDATPVDTGFAKDHWEVKPTLAGYNVSNSAPYIGKLNEGSSKQAPAHFIETTVLQYAKPAGVIVDHE